MTRMFQRENPVGDVCFFEQVAPRVEVPIARFCVVI